MSWPVACSVNDYIPKRQYLGESIEFKFPTVDALVQIIKDKGKGCLMFKKDLKRAFRQLPVDPMDWIFLGYSWKKHIFLDKVLTMGL